MTVNTYDKGDGIRLRATFTVSSVNTDPTTVTLRVKDPDGAITVYVHPASITKSATGIYYKDISVANDGVWYYRFEGTGACEAAEEYSFIVRTSEF